VTGALDAPVTFLRESGAGCPGSLFDSWGDVGVVPAAVKRFPSWANYIGLKFYLEDLLGCEVDLVTLKGLKPAVRPSVEKDLLYVVS